MRRNPTFRHDLAIALERAEWLEHRTSLDIIASRVDLARSAFCFADPLGRDKAVFLQRLWALECLNSLTADGRLPKTLFLSETRGRCLRFSCRRSTVR
ncbi:hypothetical protein [Mesorhizobium sp. LNHC209A00]|uniref:hypothetical protein n=1 Tax=Mesorhizobium australicum TaxID=536018 RepID=UPI0004CED2CB